MTAVDQRLTRDAFIAGEWRAARSGRRFASIDPSTGEHFADVAEGGPEDIDEAVRSAAAAFPGWRARKPLERGRILLKLAERIDAETEMLAELETRDSGKPTATALADVRGTARYFEYYGGMADKLQGETIPLGDDYVSYTRHEPFGVVGVIIPWNGPIQQAARSVAPALMTGNAVVAKPAEQTPLSCLELARLAFECGVPAGAFNVVPGFGEVAGAALVEHPLVSKVAFTGSVETGRLVASVAAKRLIPVTLELGGKSPHIIFADADIDAAARGAWLGINVNAGQVCSAGSRLFVHRSVHDEVVARLQQLNSNLTIGPGPADCFMGPLVSAEHKQTVDFYLALAEQEGATVHVGGRPAADLPPGSYTRPVLLTGVSNDMRVAREEIFGPVLVIIPFETEDEVVALANDSEFGLAAGLWTSDVSRAHRVAAQLQAGQVYINEYWAGGVETPFGGVKNSGYGREKGVAGALDYTYLKTVTLRLLPQPPTPIIHPPAHSELDS
jgi:aldehyde dehydrogenase (NAD+)